MAETPHRRRQIPWRDVIKHHKEITRRAEEEFFSLPVYQADSERWSSISSSCPENFAGPWKLNTTDLNSTGMQRSIKAEGPTEYFLGCACWHAMKKIGDKWVIDWRPAIYRQVEILVDEGKVVLKPTQGKWEVSPLVFSLLDKKSSHPAQELDEWLPQLLESAFKHHENTNDDLASALIEIFKRDVPALGDEIQKQFPQDKKNIKPSQWIIFSPPLSTAAVNQHLMADYKRIEIRLETDEKDIGGFRLFEDVKAFPDQQVELLPIVALNESQRTAVSNILQGKPVTVISGPPGCGKSQVVVSALLNAWARGTTVVFASNNNKAVDVVRERIKKFEEDFPVAVRAGSRRESNLEEALRQALNVVTDTGRKKGSEESAKKQKKLSESRKSLQQFIDSNIPQRVDQSLKSALNAYAKYLETSRLLNEKDMAVRQALAGMHYRIKAESFEAELLIPFRDWLEESNDVRVDIANTEQERGRLDAEIKHTRTLRDGACQREVGLEPQQISSWEWLISGPSPDILRVWRDKLRETLDKPIEGALEQFIWEDSYSRWNSSSEAKKWASDTNKLLTDVRNSVSRLTPVVSQIKAAQAKFKAQQQVIHDAGIPENAAPDHVAISSWMVLFAEHTTAPETKTDWLPWSNHKKRDRQLQQLEKQLRPAFPISIWQRIGTLNNEGRSTLGGILEKSQVWTAVQRQWQEMESNIHDVENTYFLLRSKANSLGFINPPKSPETEEWQAFETVVTSCLGIAEAAEKAWKKKEEKEATVAHLRALVAEFEAHGSGIPLKEEWKKGRGLQLDSALKAMGDTPTVETLVAARTALYTAPLDDFLTCWEEARQNEEVLRKLDRDLYKLPSNDHMIETWWKRHPKQLPVEIVKYPRLPAHDDLLFDHLSACSAWQERWESYRDNDRPQLQKIISEESTWAREALGKVADSLPPDFSEKAKTLVQKVLTDAQSGWPTNELLNAFSEFGPEAIKARIEGIDQELEALSFAFARDEWIGKLAEDVGLQETLSRLLNNFERKRGRIEESDYELFRNALKAVPIWITTAQATQSIPLLPELFDLLIIDEATQCTVTNLLPLVYRAKHIAVIGDKEQLEAITSLSPAAENVLANTFGVDHLLDLLGHTKNTVYGAFVQCLPKRYSDVIALDEHYRSHPLIIGFANEHVYKKKLRLKKDPSQGVRIPSGAGLFCKDVEGVCQRDKRGQSWQNTKEAEAVVATIRSLRAESQFARFSVGVVSPFKAQVEIISELLDKEGLLTNTLVGTAHSFQGDERDVIIFSPVVSKGITEGAATWVEKPPNLINVAVTRAREALFLVGNLACCRQQPGILGKLASYANEVETLRNTSMEELELFSWMVIQGWAPEVHPVVGDIEVDFSIRYEGRKIAIEVDGTQHDLSTVEDSARDAFLKGKGYMVVRIPARAVRETPSICIEKIESVMKSINI